MTKDGITLTTQCSDLHALKLHCKNNPECVESVFNLALSEDEVFDFYVSNVDQLRVFVSIFSMKINSRAEIFQHIMSLTRFNSLVDDIDAVIQISNIFDSNTELTTLIRVLTAEDEIFNRIIPDEECLNIAKNHFQDYCDMLDGMYVSAREINETRTLNTADSLSVGLKNTVFHHDTTNADKNIVSNPSRPNITFVI